MKIILTEIKAPTGGYEIWHKDYHTKPLAEIEEENQDTFQSFSSVGYNSFCFCRVTGSVHIRKVEVKTIEDVFITDQYGLLSDPTI
jgi:hypothetical protein